MLTTYKIDAILEGCLRMSACHSAAYHPVELIIMIARASDWDLRQACSFQRDPRMWQCLPVLT
eukprot:11204-Eustigmatos_ZCMA.PRE.1